LFNLVTVTLHHVCGMTHSGTTGYQKEYVVCAVIYIRKVEVDSDIFWLNLKQIVQKFCQQVAVPLQECCSVHLKTFFFFYIYLVLHIW
jgi:hypothetical protein